MKDETVIQKIKRTIRKVISTEVEVDPRLLEAIKKHRNGQAAEKKKVPASP